MSDLLDKETSISVDLTQAGVTGSAKSRFVAAVDRLGGNLVDLLNPPLERRTSKQRAVAHAEVRMIEAAGEGEVQLLREGARIAVGLLNYAPDFAERAMVQNIRQIMEKQQNKDAVLKEALEDLRHNRPSEVASHTGPENMDEHILARLEQYSESASKEDIRQKWGRVLSTEVRAPGTFSLKVLRVIDEIDVDVAQTFESLCEMNLYGALPKCLVGELPFQITSTLVMAGLILDPVAGHTRRYAEGQNSNGDLVWGLGVGPDEFITFPKSEVVPELNDRTMNGPVFHQSENLFSNTGGVPALSVYVLTDAGRAISTIFPPNNARLKYLEKLVVAVPNAKIVC